MPPDLKRFNKKTYNKDYYNNNTNKRKLIGFIIAYKNEENKNKKY